MQTFEADGSKQSRPSDEPREDQLIGVGAESLPPPEANATERPMWLPPKQPVMLVLALLAGGGVALSIHVVMLASGVPFPVTHAPGWTRWLNLTFIVGGALAFLRWTAPSYGRSNLFKRTLVTFLVMAMLQETARAMIMTAVVTGGWLQPIIALSSPAARTLLLAVFCVVASRWSRSIAGVIVAAPLVAGAATAANVVLGWLLAPVLQYGSRFARDERYAFPYPVHVTIAAYVTFTEAVAGAALMTMLVWNQMPGSRTSRLISLALLAALIKGVVGGTFVYGAFTGSSVAMGMFSWSQFLFEFLALGALTGLAWSFFGATGRPSEAASK